jgi:predicted HTH transcriptional regulator
MSKYLQDLILQGEHQTLDFKYQINDAAKIARSISSFSNTSGGRLLIGVKDNGKIAGIRSEEEYFMIETAAQLFCKPSVDFDAIPHIQNGKHVLEVIIPYGETIKPVLAPDTTGKMQAYIRLNDMNHIADDIQLTVWKLQRDKKGAYICLVLKYGYRLNIRLSSIIKYHIWCFKFQR